MELFYCQDIVGEVCRMDGEESAHCVKVMRHRSGDEVFVADGEGTLLRCRLVDASPKQAVLTVLERFPHWHALPYHLTMAVCPTKNSERFEWFAEKATELGVDTIVPVIAAHSERRVFKGERLRRILVSAAKQSLKASVPVLAEAVDIRQFVASAGDGLKMVAYCFEDEEHPRVSVVDALKNYSGRDITVLIGPEGDFSEDEIRFALASGFVPVHLGASRLRTETAALASVGAVYCKFINS